MQLNSSITKKAYKILTSPENYPGLQARATNDRLLLIWCYPSFAPYCSRPLFVQNTNQPRSYSTRRIKWQQCHNVWLGREPFTVGCEAAIDISTTEAIVQKFTSLKLQSLEPRERIGIDGIIYGVESSKLNCYFSWWTSCKMKDRLCQLKSTQD